MGLFDLVSEGIKSSKARLKIFDLEEQYIKIICSKMSLDKMNEELFALFSKMAEIAWTSHYSRNFYLTNNVEPKYFIMLFMACSFSKNNDFIISKQKLLSNLILIDNPEKHESMLKTIFLNNFHITDPEELKTALQTPADILLECNSDIYS